MLGRLNTLEAQAPAGAVERFVAHLANLCAGRELPPETKLASAASAILREGYPGALFCDADALNRLARRFNFWPS